VRGWGRSSRGGSAQSGPRGFSFAKCWTWAADCCGRCDGGNPQAPTRWQRDNCALFQTDSLCRAERSLRTSSALTRVPQ